VKGSIFNPINDKTNQTFQKQAAFISGILDRAVFNLSSGNDFKENMDGGRESK
jgi:hypothetical protein